MDLLIRQALSVAIVDMVNQTTLTEAEVESMSNDPEQCPMDPELEYEGGEFNWNRYEESMVLSAFYVGRVFSLVRSSRIQRPPVIMGLYCWIYL